MKDFDPQAQKIVKRGQGPRAGYSQRTPQTTRMHAGSGKLHGSYPKSPQKLRG